MNFMADTGTSLSIIPHSVAERNKLKVVPADKDEPLYTGVTGMRLNVVGQTTMYINFKTMKTTKKLRAMYISDRVGCSKESRVGGVKESDHVSKKKVESGAREQVSSSIR